MKNTPTNGWRSRSQTAAKLVRLAAVVALVLLGLSLFTHKIIDTDIWWHLRTGEYIVETHSVPGADMYSYTAGGNTWIDLHWLFQVALYATYGILGSYGLSLLSILIFSFTFVILWMACAPGRNHFAAVFLFWLALMAGNSRFLARPEAFTYLMISVYTLVLLRFEHGRCGRSVFVLIPLQAVWTNMQGLFILGPFLIFAHMAQPIALTLISRILKREPGPERPGKTGTLVAVFLGSIAACLINPYGLEGFLFPFTLFTRAGGMENIFAHSIAELQPPFSGYNLTLPLKYFGFFFGLCAAVLALDFRNLKLSHIIIFGGMGYLALNARRNVAIFVVAFLPLAVIHVSNLLDQLGKVRNGKYDKWLNRLEFAASAILVLAILFQVSGVTGNQYYISDKRAERFGFGFKEQTFPHGAFVFAKEKRIRGPFFNNLDIGGMFIWEMYPEEKVFIDARLEVNSARLLSEYRPATSDANAFARLSDAYGFNAAIVSHTSQDALYLMPIMYSSSDWALVHLDPIAAVFVRATPENGDIVNENRIDVARDHIEPFAPHDTLNDSSPRLLRAALGRIAPTICADAEAQNRFNLGLVLLVMGQHERAVEQLRLGLDLMPSSSEGHYNLGLAYDRTGRMESATEHYTKAIELNARHARAHANLGRVYDESGLKEKAEKEYRLAVKWDKGNPVPLFNLGALYYERGNHEAAGACWQRALKADPSFTPAREALKNLKEKEL